MNFTEVLEQVRVGDSFYRESKPDILYERIGTLIERSGLGWAKLEGSGQHYEWRIIPEQRIDEDVQATDWTIRKGNLSEYNPSAKSPRIRPIFSEKTRHAWTFYDQVEAPKLS
jgi:hypothetical protein